MITTERKRSNANNLIVLVLLYLCSIVDSANWAQASGEIQQNTAIPYYPSGSNFHWGPRYGHATIVTPPPSTALTGSVFLLGGDTYNGDKTSRDFIPGMMDYSFENGFKNDVWYMTGTTWYMKGDPRLRTMYKQKIPQVKSNLEWKLKNPGDRPDLGTTQDEWIQCDPYFEDTPNYAHCTDEEKQQLHMWSPRRHHGGVYFKGNLFVLGGRAREFVPLPEERSVGGIIGPRIKDATRRGDKSVEQIFSQQREAIVTKNDVWRSDDNGQNWHLVTPGCKVAQSQTLLGKGNPHDGKTGDATQACSVDSDCYGAEICDQNLHTCVCTMWSPREQHAVAVDDNFIYVSGGYVSVQVGRCGGYMCGDIDASSNRYYMSDVWRSPDGEHWELLNDQAFIPPIPLGPPDQTLSAGRGGHQMLLMPYTEFNVMYMWIFAGRGSDNTPGKPETYYDDVWIARVTNDTYWPFFPLHVPGARLPINATFSIPAVESLQKPLPWIGRTAHTMAVMPISNINPDSRVMYVYGGYMPDNNGTFLDDCWSWRLDDPKEFWRQDYTPQELFSNGKDSDVSFAYYNNSPTIAYVSPDNDVSYLQRFWVPAKQTKTQPNGLRMEVRPYMTPEKLEMLYSVGVHTIRELAEIDLYTLLKLRGFDFPQVPLDKRMTFTDICDFRELAIQLVAKCTINLPSLYDGERNMPWNIQNVFGGAYPENDSVAWHGRQHFVPPIEIADDILTLTAEWDGCTYVPAIEGLFGPNVDGLGYVDQVLKITDPLPTLEELFCRQYPTGRAYHTMVVFEQRLYVMGGKQSESVFYADTWYRDDNLPIAKIKKRPRKNTPDEWFQFVSDEPGVFFEYRIWDPYNYKELRPWTPVTHKTSIAWLNWRENGPGNGYYQLYVRAVDPAGNRDEKYFFGVNVYEWYYVSPTPWDIIAEVIGGFIGLCLIAYMEYRRRVKKAAMERYAMKRMRRKFKAMQRDINGKAVDWRTLYTEQKQAEELNGIVKTKKKKKKDRDKNAEKREKEKKKREKEKELIKKKLKATKDFKGKEKGPPPGIQEAVPIAPGGGKGKGKKSKVDALDDDDEVNELEQGFNDELVKKGGKVGPRTKLKKNKVAVAEEAPMSPEDMFMDKSYLKQQSGGGSLIGDRKSGKSMPGKGSQLVIEGSTKEIRAGDLKSSKDTEKGVKQRKVNKKYSSYEDAGGAVVAEEIEEEKADFEHKNKDA